MDSIDHPMQAEAAAPLSDRRLAALLNRVSDGVLVVDANWRLRFLNHAAEAALAVKCDTAIGALLWGMLPSLAETKVATRLRQVAETGAHDCFEIDHAGRAYEFAAAPSDDGGLSIMFSDITALKSGAIQRRHLVDELNHRVNNTLAVVQSLAVQSLRSEVTVERARQTLDERLATLAGAHGLLMDAHWEDVSLRDVVEAAIAASADRDRFSLEGPALMLAQNSVVTFALALHELCANARKHGALGAPDGRVAVRWAMVSALDGSEWLHFVWTETGGPPASRPATPGFGSRLLARAVAGELRGHLDLDFAPEGLRCTVRAPVPVGC